MTGERLKNEDLELAMAGWDEPARRLGLAVRHLVLDIAPALTETIAFGGLCYVKPGRPYGVIGGNVCGLEAKDGEFRITFLHGASLPDPDGLLWGRAKAMRRLTVRGPTDLEIPAVAALIRAAIDYDPASMEA